jgi:hypothetical protein
LFHTVEGTRGHWMVANVLFDSGAPPLNCASRRFSLLATGAFSPGPYPRLAANEGDLFVSFIHVKPGVAQSTNRDRHHGFVDFLGGWIVVPAGPPAPLQQWQNFAVIQAQERVYNLTERLLMIGGAREKGQKVRDGDKRCDRATTSCVFSLHKQAVCFPQSIKEENNGVVYGFDIYAIRGGIIARFFFVQHNAPPQVLRKEERGGNRMRNPAFNPSI